MPEEVIKRVNEFGKAEGQPELMTFYDRKGLMIGELENPGKTKKENIFDPYDDEADGLEPPTINGSYGIEELEEEISDYSPTNNEINDQENVPPPMEEHTIEAYVPEILQLTDEARSDVAFDNTLQAPHDTATPEIEATGVRRTTRVRNKPECIVPSFKGKAYKSTTATMVSIKENDREAVIHPDYHINSQFAMVSHFVMTQLSMKAGLKRWPAKGELAVTQELEQLHFRDTFQPMLRKKLTKNKLTKHLSRICF